MSEEECRLEISIEVRRFLKRSFFSPCNDCLKQILYIGVAMYAPSAALETGQNFQQQKSSIAKQCRYEQLIKMLSSQLKSSGGNILCRVDDRSSQTMKFLMRLK